MNMPSVSSARVSSLSAGVPVKKLLLAILVCGITVQAQEFEVASVRQSAPETLLESYVPTLNITPGGTLRLQNRQLKELIMIAYGIGGRELAGPRWLIEPGGNARDVPRFDIVAKVPADAKPGQGPAMLQKLLTDRFRVRAHREQRQITIYALEVAKGGLKIQSLPAAGDERQSGCARSMFGPTGTTTATCWNMTPAQLAQQLQTLSPAYFPDGPVVDHTSLANTYTFELEWITMQQRDAGEDGPSMFDALEKLGLHISKEKGESEVLVVDSADPMPADN